MFLDSVWASLPLVAALASAAAPVTFPEGLPPVVTALLRTGRWDATPRGFRVIALSHIADACAARGKSPEAQACLHRVYELALATRPAGAKPPSTEHGLWLTHFALIFGAADAIGACPDHATHEAIAEALARRALAEPTAIGPSYPSSRSRWPADQAATLAALARADRAHGTHHLAAPLAAYERSMSSRQTDGLPWSEATTQSPTSKLPRGCALSWTVRYLAEADPEQARAIWTRYRDRYLVDRAILVGFREWPPGKDLPADVDSGPIVQGVGAAATAFALLAARAMQEDLLAARLAGTATLVGAASKHDETILAQSILAASKR